MNGFTTLQLLNFISSNISLVTNCNRRLTNGDSPSSHSIMASVYSYAFNVDTNVSYLTFKDLHFEKASGSLLTCMLLNSCHYIIFSDSSSGINTGITITDCVFKYAGRSGKQTKKFYENS